MAKGGTKLGAGETVKVRAVRTNTGGKINKGSKTRGPSPVVGGGGRRALVDEGTSSASGALPRRGRPKGEETVLLGFRLPPGLIERVDAAALERGMTRTALVRRYIEEGLDG